MRIFRLHGLLVADPWPRSRLRLLRTGLRLLTISQLVLPIAIGIPPARSKGMGILSGVRVLRVNFLPCLPRGLSAGGTHGHLNFAADLGHFHGELLSERRAV